MGLAPIRGSSGSVLLGYELSMVFYVINQVRFGVIFFFFSVSNPPSVGGSSDDIFFYVMSLNLP